MAINERQLKLYNYLLNQEGWTNRVEILRDLASDYNYVDYGDLYHNASAVLLTSDIRTLNNSSEVRKLIIHNSRHGIKIATKEEAREFLRKDQVENIKRMQKHYFLQEKLYKDGQGSMNGETIQFLETFRR